MHVTATPTRGLRRLRAFRLAPVLVFVLGVLFLAGIVHIVVILLVPVVATADGWSRLSAVAENGRFAPVAAAKADGDAVPGLDPLFVHGACRIDVSEGPARLAFSAGDRFWSLALYDSRGIVVFSVNDRTAVDGSLGMLVVTPVQNAELRESDPAALAENIVVESEETDLIALVRFYAPTPPAETEARAILGDAVCSAASPDLAG